MTDSTAFNLEFPQIYSAPLVTGQIRQQPEDFFVEELLGYQPSGSGEHCFIWVQKRETNTEWVAEQFGTIVGIKKRDVNYAGRKDRHAVTRQWFSLWLPGQPSPSVDQLSLPDVDILQISRHARKLRRGSHEGNRFDILIRGISPVVVSDDGEWQRRLEGRLSQLAADGFPNYFGPQRFGFDGHNLIQAQKLIDGLLASGEEKRRRGGRGDIYLSAARSYLFNLVLAARIHDDSWRQIDDHGRPLTGPLPGLIRKAHPADEYDRVCLSNAMGDTADRWRQCFMQIGMKASRRPLRIVPEALGWQWQDDTLRLKFSLPVGSYATALLEQLFVLQ